MSNHFRWNSRRSRTLERDSRHVTTVKTRRQTIEVRQSFSLFFNRKLVVPGDLRSYGGGNGLPRNVKQSPNFSRILEEEEEEEEPEEETEEDRTICEGENKDEVSMILVKTNEKRFGTFLDVFSFQQSRTLTPLITQSLKSS